MPKSNKSQAALLKEWASKFPDGIYTVDQKLLYCQACNQQVVCTKYFQLKQHSDTSKHQANVDRFKRNSRKQSFLASSLVDVERDQFSEDLCKALIGANIPFKILNKSALKNFLFKYCKREIPDESTLRKKYLKICYQQSVNQIQENIGESFIWASVDGKIRRKLDGFHKPHLVSVKMLEATNNSTIARFVNDGLRNFLLTGEKENRLLLLVTDADRYMLKAGRGLSIFYPNMLHVTCICHGLHRVSELIRNLFPEVDSLIANTKKVFTKTPSRVVVYKDISRDLPLPPMPILTRWGTWIEAAVFYSKNFTLVKSAIDQLEPDAISVKIAQTIFNSSEVVQKLAYIQSNFSFIPTAIKKLETQGLSLNQSFETLDAVKTIVEAAPGEIGQRVKEKFNSVMQNNSALNRLLAIFKVQRGAIADLNMPPNQIASMKYAPMVSCDVERSFSVYKNILAENRTNFTPENLEMYIIYNCESC